MRGVREIERDFFSRGRKACAMSNGPVAFVANAWAML